MSQLTTITLLNKSIPIEILLFLAQIVKHSFHSHQKVIFKVVENWALFLNLNTMYFHFFFQSTKILVKMLGFDSYFLCYGTYMNVFL